MISYRKGKKEDLTQVFNLIRELAEYEKGLHEVENSVEQMETDGFGPNPLYELFVAEYQNEIIGIGLYYYRYSTWKGKVLYIEDIVVTAKHRGKGIGKVLFDLLIKESINTNCNQMLWQVLEWNKDAINFYNKMGTRYDNEWVNCKLSREQLNSLHIQTS
ncbi:MAG: GNAT family N-acetyltransferase [Cyanobacteria bacterium P01_H01_bin.74]